MRLSLLGRANRRATLDRGFGESPLKRVPVVPIYVESPTIADEILDYTVTYGCDTLIMGKTKRRLFARRLSGDVVAEIAQHLPDGVALITRESA